MSSMTNNHTIENWMMATPTGLMLSTRQASADDKKMSTLWNLMTIFGTIMRNIYIGISTNMPSIDLV